MSNLSHQWGPTIQASRLVAGLRWKKQKLVIPLGDGRLGKWTLR